MRAVVQRTLSASVTVDGEVVGATTEPGLLVYLGVTHDDGPADVTWTARKIWELRLLRERARRTFGHRLDRAADDVAHQRARARALSPLETLRRGYAVLQDDQGHVLTSVAGVEAGAALSVRVADGRVRATAEATEPDQPDEQSTEETDG